MVRVSDDTMDFLFEARCVTEQEESPLEEEAKQYA